VFVSCEYFELIIKQFLDEAEHDMKIYANRGGSFPQKPYSAEADNCLRGFHNSSYHAQPHPIIGEYSVI